MNDEPDNADGMTQRSNGSGVAGVVGNERLTGLAGAVILVLAVIEIVTVPNVAGLLSLHFFVGVLMLGPVAVKTASTGWRFARYYSASSAYRRKGPPRLFLRVLSPILLASTLAVIGSGIALALAGPAPPPLLALHKASFLVWLVTIVVHVIAYVWRVPRLIADDWRTASVAHDTSASGRGTRLAGNVIGIVVGAVAAAALLPKDAAWVTWFQPGSETGLGISVLLVFSIVGCLIAAARRVWRS